jgi:hypothetical protein
MSFVIYDETTSRLVMSGKTFKTARGANQSAVAYIKRRLKNHFADGNAYDLRDARFAADNWSVVDFAWYNANARKTKLVTNLMSGKQIEIDINTPACCDPSTETYWSM